MMTQAPEQATIAKLESARQSNKLAALKPDRRGPGWKAVASPVAAITRPIAAKRGSAARLATEWRLIAGDYVAALSLPLRLKGKPGIEAILMLAVRPAAALEIQHQAPLIINRINQYLGFTAIGALRLVQRNWPEQIISEVAVFRPSFVQKMGSPNLSAINDENLRIALESLARHLPAGHP